MRDRAYDASIELAQERGAFPLFNADLYLSGGNFASRLPAADQGRRSASTASATRHLLSIAPTGTISLAFADNASNGIEPPFSWTYTRKKRMADGTHKEFRVEDHAWRLYRHMRGDGRRRCRTTSSPRSRSPRAAHQEMVAAVAPFIDTSISKTVNVPEDYPYERVRGPLHAGVEGRAEGPRHLPAEQRCWARCSRPTAPPAPRPSSAADGANRRLAIADAAAAGAREPALAGPPRAARGQPRVDVHDRVADGALRALRRPRGEAGPRSFPFEVWVNGAEQPRGLGAVAKTLSMDMRANDRAWLKMKLDVLAQDRGRRRVRHALPAARREAARARRGLGARAGGALALRAAARLRRPAAPRRCSTPCSAWRSRAPAPTARCPGRWTSPTPPRATSSCSG